MRVTVKRGITLLVIATAVLLLVILQRSLFSTALASARNIKNGNFEAIENELPIGWAKSYYGGADETNTSVTVVTGAESFEGNSLKIQNSTAGGLFILDSPRVAVEGGKSYALTYMYKSGNDSARTLVQIFQYNGLGVEVDNKNYWDYALYGKTDGWKEVKVVFSAQPAAVNLFVRIYVSNTGSDYAYYDNVSLTASNNALSIPNSDFERFDAYNNVLNWSTWCSDGVSTNGAGYTVEPVSGADAFSGKSLKITNNTNSDTVNRTYVLLDSYQIDMIKLLPARDYIISYMYKTDVSADPNVFSLLGIHEFNALGTQTLSEKWGHLKWGPDGSWTKVEVPVTFKEDTTHFFIRTYTAYTGGTASAYYDNFEITPVYKDNTDLGVKLSSGNLEVGVSGSTDSLQYQFWAKENITTDGIAANQSSTQSVWTMFKGFSNSATATLDLATGDYLVNGKYHLIVRVKDGSGKIVKEIFSSYSPAQVGPFIEAVSIDGVMDKDIYAINRYNNPLVTVYAKGNGALGGAFKLYNGEKLIAESNDGYFNIPLSGLKEGKHRLKIVYFNTDAENSCFIDIYLYDEYIADERPVIDSLSIPSGGGEVEVVMTLKYGDGSNIALKDAADFNLDLKSQGVPLAFKEFRENAGVLEAVFEHNYASYGIYLLSGSVSRAGVSGVDDSVLKYYHYTRETQLDINAYSEGDQTAAITTAALGTTFKVKAQGVITGYGQGQNDTIRFIFLREDASGWVTMQNSESDVLTWKPTKAGIYNIAVKIQAGDAGSFEAERSIQITVTDAGADPVGTLTVKLADLSGAIYSEGAVLRTGVPYKIVAEYSEATDVLYMFTVYTDSMLTKYLNHYTTSSEITFIPSKNQAYFITARVIRTDSYGFMDTGAPINVTSSHIA